jgi:transposase-like protein
VEFPRTCGREESIILDPREEGEISHRIYTPEFKDEAVRQVVERGYSVKEVAERLGISEASLYN